MSPTSLKVTNELMLRGAGLSLADCLRMEFRLSQHFMVRRWLVFHTHTHTHTLHASTITDAQPLRTI